jgi:glycosyltransferase involved in cell wall biosynthesis
MTGPVPAFAAASSPQFRFGGSISVFFPAYNDAPSLPSLLERTFAVLRNFVTDYEVIVVNDGSSDNTVDVLTELCQLYTPHLRVVTHPKNLGYGGALRSGFAAATKEFIFYTDGDGQYDPGELENLLRAVTPETGLVNGYKIERNDPWHRIAIGWLYNRFASFLFRIRLRDIDCDFRLIRRSVLDHARLRSTGGTICVELIRSIEMTGTKVVELPMHHYARQYGRSQFFRLRSLAVTFVQLCLVFARLVLWPALTRTPSLDQDGPPSRRMLMGVVIAATLLSFLAYGWALRMPFIADDYLQIQLARDWGPIDRWPDLARDALYRCRATSIVLTHWIDSAAGLTPFYYNLASILLHVVNTLLVFALGFWKQLGWRISAIAALTFAMGQRKSEAIVWLSAMPELLVFFFTILSFLLFIAWLQSGKRWAYGVALLAFLLALLSKESAVAVAPLCAMAVLIEPRRDLRKLWSILPFALASVAYFALIFSARETHLHFNDGTFSLSAPVLEVMARSVGGLIWIWGVVFLPLFLTRDARVWRTVLLIAGAWMLITLLPYSFLTYMPRVPSRHTYLASVGRSLLLAAGFLTLARLSLRWDKRWMVATAAMVLVIHECGYLWFVKQRQYVNRALPTEQLVQIGMEKDGPIYAACFPYSAFIGEAALKLRSPSMPFLVLGPEAASHPEAIDFCNEDADGQHY